MNLRPLTFLGIAALLPDVLAAATQEEKNAFLSREKWYMSFEISLTGRGTSMTSEPSGTYSKADWSINRHVSGEAVLDNPIAGMYPPSHAPKDARDLFDKPGRYIGWMPAPPSDAVMESILANPNSPLAKSHMFWSVDYRIRDITVTEGKGRGEHGLDQYPTVTVFDLTGAGSVNISKGAYFNCDLEDGIFDAIPETLAANYYNGPDRVRATSVSTEPSAAAPPETLEPAMFLPLMTASLKKALAGKQFSVTDQVIKASASEAITEAPGNWIGAMGKNSSTNPLQLAITVRLSPTPPKKARFIIRPSDEYAKWRPTPGPDEDTPDTENTLRFHWEIVEEGATPEKRTKPVKVTFHLGNVSRYPGVCMNWPPEPQGSQPPYNGPGWDLQFKKDPDYSSDVMWSEEGLTLIIKGASAERAKGTEFIDSFDGAAIGEVVGEAELEDGRLLTAEVESGGGGSSQNKLLIPDRDEGVSEIAKEWRRLFADGQGDAEDEDEKPKGDGQKGDGLSVWEEYRGFWVGGEWQHGFPKYKDLFIENKAGPRAESGISLFEESTGLKVQRKLKEQEQTPDRIINFQVRGDRHVVDQHCLVLEAVKGGIGQAVPRLFAKFTGPPKNTERVNVLLSGAPEGLDRHIAHELSHGIGVYHHGDRDNWLSGGFGVNWYKVGALGSYVVFENTGGLSGGAQPIAVLREPDLQPADLNEIFGTANSAIVGVGRQHGQHSGVVECVMRYVAARAYESQTDPQSTRIWHGGGEKIGDSLCNAITGTDVNARSRPPQSRYGDADTLRGNCSEQFVISDRWNIKDRDQDQQNAARQGGAR